MPASSREPSRAGYTPLGLVAAPRATGTTFGVRGDLSTTKEEQVTKRFLFIKRQKTVKEQELYWPGMFVQFNSKADGKLRTARGEDIFRAQGAATALAELIAEMAGRTATGYLFGGLASADE